MILTGCRSSTGDTFRAGKCLHIVSLQHTLYSLLYGINNHWTKDDRSHKLNCFSFKTSSLVECEGSEENPKDAKTRGGSPQGFSAKGLL